MSTPTTTGVPRVPAREPHEYTVGWIAPLDIEGAAAEAMLDVIHEEPKWKKHDRDENQYVLGSIITNKGEEHHIVITGFAGTYGPVEASSTAQQLLSTFPSIVFGL